MSGGTFPPSGGSTSLLERKVQNMLHRDVDGVKVQRSQQQSFSHSRNNTLTLNPNSLSALSATTSSPSPATASLVTPSTRPSHLTLPESTAGDESPLSITRRQSSVQLNKRDLAAISDEDEVTVAQYTGNGRSGWRGRPISTSAATPLPAGELVERTQSLSVLSPLPEVPMERGLSERQTSSSAHEARTSFDHTHRHAARHYQPSDHHQRPLQPLPHPPLLSRPVPSLTRVSRHVRQYVHGKNGQPVRRRRTNYCVLHGGTAADWPAKEQRRSKQGSER